MIPLCTREQVRAIDAHAMSGLGIPGLVLMENAGAGAAGVVLEVGRGRLERAVIVGGVGQNGGDAWVVARKLLTAGINPRCVLVGRRDQLQGDALVNFEALLRLGVSIECVTDDSALHVLRCATAGATLVVDGLFGTGLARPLEGVHAQAVALLNASPALRVALDLPSGIDCDTGQVLGVAVRAGVTVTFAAHKRGLYQHPGAGYAGEIRCVDIGVPATTEDTAFVTEVADLSGVLTPRAVDSHKGTNGHVLAIAGSPGKTGAALLAALGALRGGAGLVTIAAEAATRDALDHKVLEIMTALLEPAPETVSSVLALAAGKSAALLGPGLGLGSEISATVRELARVLPVPCVLDADALTALAPDLEGLRGAQAARVLTPHPGEAARLLGCSTQAVQSDRYGAALTLARRSAHVVVLKGAGTLTASPRGELRVCPAGTPALGVAGTGDVLSGLIAALLCELSPFEAAWAAVVLHALAGERAAVADRGLLASELAAAIPSVLGACLKKRG